MRLSPPDLDTQGAGRWLHGLTRAGGLTRARLFCFPSAGAGAAAFRDWQELLSPDVEVVGVRLPGRESRFGEAPFDDVGPLIDALEPIIRPHLDIPFAFFGHSMGGLVAFETARRLRRSGAPEPLHLFVSGRRAPDAPEPRPPMRHLDDVGFLAELQERYGELPGEVVDDEMFQKVFLRCLRADITLVETHVHRPGVRLEFPITGFCGSDDSVAGVSLMEPWREHTRGGFRLVVLPGGHFFLNDAVSGVTSEVAATLAATVAGEER
jgi:surfactin synthase thioesterase subunit